MNIFFGFGFYLHNYEPWKEVKPKNIQIHGHKPKTT